MPKYRGPLQADATWKALELGSAPDGWKDVGFADSGWTDVNAASAIAGVPTMRLAGYSGAAANRLYRKEFYVEDVALVGADVEFTYLVDNSGTFYVNGLQIAQLTGTGSDNYTTDHATTLARSTFRAGWNCIAVETSDNGVDHRVGLFVNIGTSEGQGYSIEVARCDHHHRARDIWENVDLDVQAALDALRDHLSDSDDAHDGSAVSYDNAVSGLTATDVQAAIDEHIADHPTGGGGSSTGSYAETIGDGGATSYQVTHGLDSEDVIVQLYDLTGSDPVEATADASSITVDDSDSVTIVFGTAPATDAYRVVVLATVPRVVPVYSQLSGTQSVAGTTWAAMDSSTDLVIPAVAGDLLEVSLALRAGAENNQLFNDVYTMVGGSPVNSAGINATAPTGTSGTGPLIWEAINGIVDHASGSVFYTVQAGDISGGNVTLRWYRRTTLASPTRSVSGASRMHAKNWG